MKVFIRSTAVMFGILAVIALALFIPSPHTSAQVSQPAQPYETHSGVCSGAATASTATGPASFGSTPASGACSSAFGGGFGQALGLASGNLKNLVCTSGHVGAGSTDGVCTVYLGSAGTFAATTLTCTIGTASFCVDTTHTAAAIAGQQVSCQIVPAGTTALTGLSCTVGYQ